MALTTWLRRISWVMLAMLTASLALAHDGATGIVKERMDAMKSIAQSTKQIGLMLKGEADFDQKLFNQAALAISAHGGEAMTKFYPKDSLDAPTEALPIIWEQWDHFSKLANRLQDNAAALAISKIDSSATKQLELMNPKPSEIAAMPPSQAFRYVAATCKECHETFRVEKP